MSNPVDGYVLKPALAFFDAFCYGASLQSIQSRETSSRVEDTSIREPMYCTLNTYNAPLASFGCHGKRVFEVESSGRLGPIVCFIRKSMITYVQCMQDWLEL